MIIANYVAVIYQGFSSKKSYNTNIRQALGIHSPHVSHMEIMFQQQ